MSNRDFADRLYEELNLVFGIEAGKPSEADKIKCALSTVFYCAACDGGCQGVQAYAREILNETLGDALSYDTLECELVRKSIAQCALNFAKRSHP